MRVLSLRARVPGATPIELHPRLTVVLGATAQDREALRSTFGALTSGAQPALEAIVDLDGVSIPLDPSFATTYGLRGAPAAVIEVPSLAVGAGPTAPPEFANQTHIASLRAEQRAVHGELTLVGRALAEERAALESMPASELRRRRSRVDEAIASTPRASSAQDGAKEETQRLVEDLRVLMGRDRRDDALALAERLEVLAHRHGSTRDRSRALAQLMAECRAAIESTRRVVEVGATPQVPPSAIAEVEQVREEMLSIAAGSSLSRGQRRRLAELREVERRLLDALGHPSYASLQLAGDEVDDGMQGDAAARLGLLEDLAEFWEDQRDLLDQERAEEEQLLTHASDLLGESVHRNASLVAARLRNLASTPSASARAQARRVAAQLAALLGPGAAGRSPEEVLAVAEARLVEQGTDPLVPAGGAAEVHREQVVEHLREAEQVAAQDAERTSRVRRLEEMEADLGDRLRQIEQRLVALERAGDLGGQSAVLGSQAGGKGPLAGPPSAGAGWSLAEEVQHRTSLPLVGALPTLIEEPLDVRSVLHGEDPLAVVALAASVQLVWVTARAEVTDAMVQAGDLAAVIHV